MVDPNEAVVFLAIATVVLFALLILGVWLATRPQAKKD